MKKIIAQLLIAVAAFFALFFVLKQVDWMNILKVEKLNKSTEEKLGDMFWDMFNKSGKEIKDKNITIPIDSILVKICKSNKIDPKTIKLHIVKSEEINAFALPNNHLVVFSGLIEAAENEAELSGVMAHELAHIQLNHVMKKLVKEMGLSVLLSITTGNAGSETIKEAAKLLSSSAYDRNLEKEADIKAVDYLIKCNIDTEPFANFLFRLGESESSGMKYFTWISTHPDSKERAEYIIEYSHNKTNKKLMVLSADTWKKLQKNLNEN